MRVSLLTNKHHGMHNTTIAMVYLAHNKKLNESCTCRFSRRMVGLDPYPQDLPLNKSLYLEFGRSNQGRGMAETQLMRHTV